MKIEEKQRYYVVMETTATVEANSEEEAIQIAKKGEDSNGVELGYHVVDKVTKIRKVKKLTASETMF